MLVIGGCFVPWSDRPRLEDSWDLRAFRLASLRVLQRKRGQRVSSGESGARNGRTRNSMGANSFSAHRLTAVKALKNFFPEYFCKA